MALDFFERSLNSNLGQFIGDDATYLYRKCTQLQSLMGKSKEIFAKAKKSKQKLSHGIFYAFVCIYSLFAKNEKNERENRILVIKITI